MATLLQSCGCGRFSELNAQYFCFVCHSVKCRHPECTMEAVEGYFCPNCLMRFATGEALQCRSRCVKCFECRKCRATVSVCHSPPVSGAPPSYFFLCGHCHWSSTEDAVVASSFESLLRMS